MNGPCGHDQSAMDGGGGPDSGTSPGGRVGVPGAQPRIGGVPAGHPGAGAGQTSQGSALASRSGLAN
jgi:hypothetical protein